MNENQRKKLAAGSTFERAVLSHSYNSDPYFQKIERGAATVVQPTDPRRIVEALTKKDTKNVSGVGWWQPSKNSLFFEYLGNSSMHGLKYIAQPRRHLSERIFWAVSFLLSCAVAAYFISTVWTRYYDHPVVVAFRPVETDIHSIPFPAVTICNMNRISLDTINRLKVRASKPDNDSFAIQAKKELQFANRICNWEGSFAKMHGYAASRGNLNLTEDSDLFDKEKGRASAELVQFLFAKTNPCEEMIVLCRWGNKRRGCLDLFKPSFTRLGKCCTFNVLPTIFLYSEKIRSRYRRPQNASATPPPSPWTMEELKAWGDWDYSDGVLLNETQKQPYRQRRPGVTQGLTILLNGRTSRYFCSSTDSYGFRVHLHSPLEVSAVEKFGSVVGLGTEVYMEVQPMMTLADPGIRRVSYEKRGCLYPNEIELDYYTPYSTHNCILECTSKSIENNCSCVPFTLPRFPEISVCSSDTHSEEFQCAANVSHAVEDDWGVHCPHCIPLCASLNYKLKITRADLQNATQTWMDHSERLRRPPDWAADNLTILHIYYSRLSFLPSERRELYAITDLIANTGNLLTLCLGFSILSGVEMIYFLTVRVIINRTWRRRAGEKGEEMEKGISTKDPAGAHRESTIQSRIYPLQPSFIPDQEARSTDNNMSQKTNGKAPLYPRTTLHPPPPPPGFIFASNKIPGYTTALQPNNSIVLRRHNNKRN